MNFSPAVIPCQWMQTGRLMDEPMIDDALIDEADAFIQVIAMTRKRPMDRHRERSCNASARLDPT